MARLPLTFATGVASGSFQQAVDSALAAEAAGFDSITFGDRPQGPGLDGWMLAAAIAARTSRVRMFHTTLNLPYRYPQLLAKQAAAIDNISGGRLDLCLGAGGRTMSADYDAYGIPMRSDRERLDDLVEAIALMRALWREDRLTFEGNRFQVRDAVCEPKPVQGTIPIWTGAGKPRGLGIVGRIADGWVKNQGWGSIDDISAMKAIVNRSAEKAGRDPQTIRFVLGGAAFLGGSAQEVARYREQNPAANGLIGTKEQVLETIRAYHAAGVDTFLVRAAGPAAARTVQDFGTEIIPAAKAALG